MNIWKQRLLAAALIGLAPVAWARYVQPDPIGLQGGFNRFNYSNVDPLRFIDPSGLATQEERSRAAATARCFYPDDLRKGPNSINMSNMGERGQGQTDWSNNVTLNSHLYGDNTTPVDQFLTERFMQTMVHEMLHVNEGPGSFAMSSRFRASHPLGYFHRRLDERAENMTTQPLLDRYKQAMKNGDTGCSCVR